MPISRRCLDRILPAVRTGMTAAPPTFPRACRRSSVSVPTDETELYATTPGVITIWSDLGCPWATLALHTLRTTAARRGQEVTVDHRAFPLELFNRQPTPKHIVDSEIVAICGLRPEVGWRRWSSPEWTYPVTTLPPMEAVQAAKDPRIGGPAGSHELDGALRHAFFVEGRCISITSVILDIAKGCERVDAQALGAALAEGAGRAEVHRDRAIAEAAGAGVAGSSHIYTADGHSAHNPGVTFSWTADPEE